MLNQHDQFLVADETLETRVEFVVWIVGDDDRSRALPLNVLCLGEEILHQLLLASKLNVYMARSQSTTTV